MADRWVGRREGIAGGALLSIIVISLAITHFAPVPQVIPHPHVSASASASVDPTPSASASPPTPATHAPEVVVVPTVIVVPGSPGPAGPRGAPGPTVPAPPPTHRPTPRPTQRPSASPSPLVCIKGICPIRLAVSISTPTAGHRFFPVLSRDPNVIWLADWLRWLCLLLGIAVAIFTVRALIHGIQPPTGVARAFWWTRMLALALGCFASSGTEYERLGDVVTLRLPINLAFLTLSVIGLVGIPTVKKADHDDWLSS